MLNLIHHTYFQDGHQVNENLTCSRGVSRAVPVTGHRGAYLLHCKRTRLAIVGSTVCHPRNDVEAPLRTQQEKVGDGPQEGGLLYYSCLFPGPFIFHAKGLRNVRA
ncbi:hypothetical protein TNIN_113091 [Trichonephila inaurata madagascariensis]|uniref:Uncharacterized protein n=1 Tax=Trichonephila inaurata madagascariensis TaxID=2747483 RepID=A0A8X6MJP5_9ARAC|nr:hypothetical protein TNIN_113091 [Trichonephila inaurata madagascariensis]